MGADRDQAEGEAEQLFLRIGLTEQTAKCAAFAHPAAVAACEPASFTPGKLRRNSVKNPKFRQALTEVIHTAGAVEGAPKARGALLYQVASKVRAHRSAHSTPTPAVRHTSPVLLLWHGHTPACMRAGAHVYTASFDHSRCSVRTSQLSSSAALHIVRRVIILLLCPFLCFSLPIVIIC